MGSSNGFNSLEKPKQITVLREQFSVENGLLTPTMKVKRNIAKIQFKEQIDKMYSMPVMALAKK